MCVLVAVRALGERQFLLEVAVRMAGDTFDRLMFALERVLGFGMVEILLQASRDPLPTAGCVASGAALLEAAVVRILVAVVALAKG